MSGSNPTITNILLLPNAALPRALELADSFAISLNQLGIRYKRLDCTQFNEQSCPDLNGCDLVVAFGGDGTLLRAGHLCAPLNIPLLGVQAGHLGFLVELSEETWPYLLPRLITGDYRLEKRMMLKAELIRAGKQIACWDVINDLVIARGMELHPVEIRVDLQEGFLTSYIADGLVVSTATGSTAYAMAAGGPILPPELRNMLVVPIAPHLSLERAVVLAEGASLILRADPERKPVVSIDGSNALSLEADDIVKVYANEKSLNMIRFGEPNDFYHKLAQLRYRNPAVKLAPND